MEARGQEKDIGFPYSSMAYNPPSYNKESSTTTKAIPSAPVASNLADRRITNIEASRSSAISSSSQTLDQHHQQNPPPPQQYITNKDSNPDPDPVQVANATIPSASNSKATPQQPQPQPQPPPQLAAAVGNNSSSIRYRECLKNHAASMGGHVVDGCGEFMSSGEKGTPDALRCAACDCHRNFHRKESDAEPQAGASSYHARHQANTSHHTSVFRPQAQTPLITVTHHQQQQHHHHHKFSLGYSHGLNTSPTGLMAPVMMSFGGNSGAAAESSSEDLNMFQYNAGGPGLQQSFSMSKKRFRTKFSQQQKERMSEFAEKLGWRIQKQDEQEVQQFCNEVGVKRQVFKVWMHNNKQAMKKKHT